MCRTSQTKNVTHNANSKVKKCLQTILEVKIYHTIEKYCQVSTYQQLTSTIFHITKIFHQSLPSKKIWNICINASPPRQGRSDHIGTYARAYTWNLRKNIFIGKRRFLIIKLADLWKISPGKRRKWHFGDPKLKNFPGEHAPRPP